MATWVCGECTATYSVGAPRCPHCGSTEYTEEGAMPKITRHGGPSIAGASTDVRPKPEQNDEEGGEESSPGNSSSASDEKPSTKPEPNVKPSPSRARTTGSRSKKAATAKGSSARGTDGGQAASSSDSDEAAS